MEQDRQTHESLFDRARSRLVGLPGFQKGLTTIRSVQPLWGGASTFVVESVRTQDEGYSGFVEAITREGTVRLYLPPPVMDAIYRQRDQLIAKTRKANGRQAAASRKVLPFRGTSSDLEG